MRSLRRFSGVFVVFTCGVVGACMVETPVVEEGDGGNDDDGGGERVENILTRCNALCEGFDECPFDAPEACLVRCIEEFQEFDGKTDVCADAGRRAMNCLERLPCTIEGVEGCSVEEEQARCRHSIGLTTCESSSLYGGGANCEIRYFGCSSGLEYTLECSDDGGSTRCSCRTGDAVDGEFAPTVCPSSNEALRICAWSVAWPSESPAPTPSPRCELGGSNGMGDADSECSLSFVACTDGHDYSVNCFRTEEGTLCECSIDGELVSDSSVTGSDSIPGDLCNFALADDDGRTAMNDACGFSIAPFR